LTVIEPARILLADDEETFLKATSEVLREKGYSCDCAPDGYTAISMIQTGHYDLLIADIKMPGNPDLELVKDISGSIHGIPIILVTGYPSADSAIEAVGLPVWAYIVKPFEIDEFLDTVRHALDYSLSFRAVARVRERLKEWSGQMKKIETTLKKPSASATPVPVSTFLSLTMQNAYGSLVDLEQLTESLTSARSMPSPCHLLDCPWQAAMRAAIRDTIVVLEETKRSFKSKELGALRKRLQSILEAEDRPE
jgi:DNA-binding response OmpR family regulator